MPTSTSGFTTLDWCIVAVLVLSCLQGLRRGFILTVASLLGFVVGNYAASRYWQLAMPLVHHLVETIWLAQLGSFFLIALLTIVVFTLGGQYLQHLARKVGIGWADRLLGACFGLLRGTLLVVLGFIIVAAFSPSAQWVKNSRLAPMFMPTTETITRGVPSVLEGRVLQGLQQFKQTKRPALPQAPVAP